MKKILTRKNAAWLLLSAILIIANGCGGGGGGSETNVAGGTLTSIAITPANASIAVNTILQYTATGTYSNGTSQNITASVAWSSDTASAATVDAAGLASGKAVGSATITATLGDISGSTTLSVTTPPTGIFTEPASPLLVSVQSDTAHAVSAVVPISGGTLTTTGVDGSAFTLVIPADALLTPTEITMTPVNSITDLPLSGGLGAAVKLAPEGLVFNNYATLTIVPAQSIPMAGQTFFAFQKNGEDFHLEPPVAGSSAIQIKLLHFCGAGVGNGTDADRAQILLRNASNAENRLNQNISEQLRLAREHNANSDSVVAILESIWSEYRDQVVTPRIQAASTSCAAGKLAMQTLLGLERQKQLLGAGSESSMDLIRDLLPQVAHNCIEEAYDACVTQHDLREIVSVVLGYERQRQLLGSTDETIPWDTLGQQMIKQCLHFELDITSTNGQTGMYDDSVKGTVPIRADLGNFPAIKIKNVPPSPLEALDFLWKDDCTQTGIAMTNTGDFIVEDLGFVFGGIDDLEITSIEMAYNPPVIYGIATLQCPGDPLPPPSQVPLSWQGIYVVLHEFEATEGMGSTMIARNWTISGGSLFAQKTYNLTGVADAFEQTTMVLRHTPGP